MARSLTPEILNMIEVKGEIFNAINQSQENTSKNASDLDDMLSTEIIAYNKQKLNIEEKLTPNQSLVKKSNNSFSF